MSASLRERIAALTEEHGGEYAVQHANRLIRLVEAVAEDVAYDAEAIWLAAHMHDWGTFPRWSKEDVPHSRRSADLAAAELKKLKCPPDVAKRALEAIEYHHGGRRAARSKRC